MPVPSTVNDLDQVASNNSPAGSEPIGPDLDAYLRAHAAIIRQVSDASKTDVQTHTATSKTTPVDADELPIADSATSFALKKLTWANLKAAIKTYLQAGMTMVGTLTLAADPVNPLEPATKQYVDSVTSGAGAAVQGIYKNLQASASGISPTVSETVDEIVLENASNQYKTLRNLTLSGALTTSGVNGLDNQAPQTVTITIASPGVVTLNGHGFPANAAVVLATSGALPTGLTAGTTYYVVNPTENTFQLSATQGGAAINTSGTQSGTHTVASVLAANCWYSKWDIWNGTTAALLFSSSATAPVLPLGYTHKACTGWVPTDGTANKYPLGFTQNDRDARYKVAAGSNVPAMPKMAGGAQGNVSTPTWVAVSVSSFVPPDAASIIGMLAYQSSAAQGTVVCAPNNAYGPAGSTSNPAPVVAAGSSETAAVPFEFLLESTNIYYASSSSAGCMFCYGWRY